MTDIMNWIKALALVSVTVLCIALTTQVVTVGKHVSRTLMDADTAISKVNATLDKVNAPGGLLQVTGKAVADTKNLIGHTDILVANEQKSIDKWDSQIGDTLSNANVALTSVKTTLDVTAKSETSVAAAATQTIQDIQPVLSSTLELQKSLQVTLVESQATAKQTTELVASLKSTAVDIQEKVHELTHPTKKKLGFWGSVYAGVKIAQRFEPSLF